VTDWEAADRCAALRARVGWAMAVLTEADLLLLAGMAERLAELGGFPPVPGRAAPEASSR
jgi:hypothetical protein